MPPGTPAADPITLTGLLVVALAVGVPTLPAAVPSTEGLSIGARVGCNGEPIYLWLNRPGAPHQSDLQPGRALRHCGDGPPVFEELPVRSRIELGQPFSLDGATATDLELLDGIGPRTASALHEAFLSGLLKGPEDLARVRGIGEVKAVTLSLLLSWPEGGENRRYVVRANDASHSELQQLPGVGPVLAGVWIRERARTPFETCDDLLRISGIGPRRLEGLQGTVDVCTTTQGEGPRDTSPGLSSRPAGSTKQMSRMESR